MEVKLRAPTFRKVLATKNLSQNSFARLIGTSGGYFSQMITGARNPSPRMRKRIMKVLKEYRFEELFKVNDNSGER